MHACSFRIWHLGLRLGLGCWSQSGIHLFVWIAKNSLDWIIFMANLLLLFFIFLIQIILKISLIIFLLYSIWLLGRASMLPLEAIFKSWGSGGWLRETEARFHIIYIKKYLFLIVTLTIEMTHCTFHTMKYSFQVQQLAIGWSYK